MVEEGFFDKYASVRAFAVADAVSANEAQVVRAPTVGVDVVVADHTVDAGANSGWRRGRDHRGHLA